VLRISQYVLGFIDISDPKKPVVDIAASYIWQETFKDGVLIQPLATLTYKTTAKDNPGEGEWDPTPPRPCGIAGAFVVAADCGPACRVISLELENKVSAELLVRMSLSMGWADAFEQDDLQKRWSGQTDWREKPRMTASRD